MENQFRLNWTVLVEEAKQRRKSQKLTQRQLGKLAGVSTPTISHFENGEKDVQLSSAIRILEMLGLVDHRSLSFQNPDPYYDVRQKRVIFWGEGKQAKQPNFLKKVQCAITSEALLDYFKSRFKDPMKIFSENANAIEQIARRKYLQNQFDKQGILLIDALDF